MEIIEALNIVSDFIEGEYQYQDEEGDELPEGKEVGDVKTEASKKVGDEKTPEVPAKYFLKYKIIYKIYLLINLKYLF